MLTQVELKKMYYYNKQTGEFTRLMYYTGESTGQVEQAHKVRIDGRYYTMARLAVLYVTGELPVTRVYTLNKDRLDTRWVNIAVTKPPAMRSAIHQPRARVTKRSGVTGVTYDSVNKLWLAKATIDGKRTHLGSSKDMYLAIKMRLDHDNIINFY